VSAGERSLLEEAIAEAGGAESFAELLGKLGGDEQRRIAFDWKLFGRPSQLAPAGDWLTWLCLAGRGWGKSRVGSEFVRGEVEAGRARRVALVAPTAADARDVMVEGESGLLAISPPWFRPLYEPSKRRLTWPNGAMATLFSADEPERLRGPQHDLAWLDELAAYYSADEVLIQARLGLRLGQRPRVCITTTPRPIPILRKLMADPSVHVTRGRTVDNVANLAPGFIDAITKQYGGTRIGRQELDAEMLDDNPGALWRLAEIDAARVKQAPELKRIAVGVDPAVSHHAGSDETGIIAAGIGDCPCRGKPERHAFVLADASGVYTPAGWARAVQAVYHHHRADRVIAEVNQGGALVEANLRANGAESLPLKTVHASKGKATRAEPIAALYEQGKVHHVGSFSRLEDQMTQWNPLEDASSPDRVDALVWVLTELMIGAEVPVYTSPPHPILPRRSASGGLFTGRRRGIR
jgi:phage terminase large subunit-like protein